MSTIFMSATGMDKFLIVLEPQDQGSKTFPLRALSILTTNTKHVFLNIILLRRNTGLEISFNKLCFNWF